MLTVLHIEPLKQKRLPRNKWCKDRWTSLLPGAGQGTHLIRVRAWNDPAEQPALFVHLQLIHELAVYDIVENAVFVVVGVRDFAAFAVEHIADVVAGEPLRVEVLVLALLQPFY